MKIRPPYMHPDIYGPDSPYRKVPLWYWKVVYLILALCFVGLCVFVLLDLLNVRVRPVLEPPLRTIVGWTVILLVSALFTALVSAFPDKHKGRTRVLRLVGVFVTLVGALYLVAR